MSHNKRKTTSSKRNNRKARNGRSQTPSFGSIRLPQINNKPLQTRCIRYQASQVSSTPTVVTSDHILRAIGTTVSGSTAYTPLIEGFYLRRVGISGIGVTGTGTLNFSWRGSNVPQTLETMFVGVGVPANRSHYPPENSSSAWWYDDQSTATDLFSLAATLLSTGDIDVYLDLEVAYVIGSGARTPITITGAASLTGVQYLSFPDTTRTFVADGLSTVQI